MVLDLVVLKVADEFCKLDAFRWSTNEDKDYLLYDTRISGTRLRFPWSLQPSDSETFYKIVVRSLLANLLNVHSQCDDLMTSMEILQRRITEQVPPPFNLAPELMRVPRPEPFNRLDFCRKHYLNDNAFEALLNGTGGVQKKDVLALRELCGLMSERAINDGVDDENDEVQAEAVPVVAAAPPQQDAAPSVTPSKKDMLKRKMEEHKKKLSPVKLKYQDEDEENNDD